jgi:hypothetical protein
MRSLWLRSRADKWRVRRRQSGTWLSADIVEMADMRVIQGRSALESMLRSGSERREGRTLIAIVRSSLVSRARYTSPMPPAPSGD